MNKSVFDAFAADVMEDFPYLENSEDEYLNFLISFLYYHVLPQYFEPSPQTPKGEKQREYRRAIEGGDDDKIHQYLAAGIKHFDALYDKGNRGV
jgi:hypothetical protein